MEEPIINKRKKRDHSHLNLELLEEKWEMQFYELKKFKKKYGHCDVPSRSKTYPVLSNWCRTQRWRAHNYPDRVTKLDEIGFTWNVLEQDFENNFRKLKYYQEKNGHCRVKESENLPLSKWCTRLRFLRRKGMLKIEKINRLTQLGFEWQEIKKLEWEKQLLRLKEYKKKHGDYNVPMTRGSPTISLACWVNAQRLHYQTKNKLLTPKKIDKLNNVGFNWVKPKERSTRIKETDLLNELKRLYKLVGKPPTIFHIKKYGKYTGKAYYTRFGGIPKAREAAQIPTNGSVFDWKWQVQFNELKKFKEKYGHCNVSNSKDKTYSELVRWCGIQRRWTQFHFPDRVKELNKIGFTWSVPDIRFEYNLRQLKLYKEKHGHCNVKESENMRLSQWCTGKRSQQRKGTLSKEKIRQLTVLGFDWKS